MVSLSGPSGIFLAAFNSLERRAAASLSLVYATRMMGLFLLLPVMSILGQDLDGATPLLIGVALGIYGLFQAVLQIPFGFMSDRFGRKRVIYVGLAMLVAGSIVAAMADSIWGVIAGRALQGAGAISAAVMALAADLSRDDQRTKMMAIIGASIGLSFVLSIMVGPLLMNRLGLSGIFIAIAVTGVLSALLVRFAVPDQQNNTLSHNRDFSASTGQIATVIKNPELLRLDIGILLLHLLITATFVCVPLGLLERGITPESHWKVYLIACLLSLLIMVPLIGWSEKGVRRVMMISIVGLGLAEIFVGLTGQSWWMIVIAIGIFFGFLNVLESLLPTMVSRIAPVACRGGAMGVYSSSQFMGAFIGGVFGGWMVGSIGVTNAHLVLGLLSISWLLVIYNMKEPAKLTSYQLSLHGLSGYNKNQLEQQLAGVGGVEEVSVIEADNVAYLKVRRKLLDEQNLQDCLSNHSGAVR